MVQLFILVKTAGSNYLSWWKLHDPIIYLGENCMVQLFILVKTAWSNYLSWWKLHGPIIYLGENCRVHFFFFCIFLVKLFFSIKFYSWKRRKKTPTKM